MKIFIIFFIQLIFYSLFLYFLIEHDKVYIWIIALMIVCVGLTYYSI